MPDPDGVETLHLLRQDFAGVNYDTKVIVLTANVFAGVREKYIADGFVDYLSKPIDPELLERCIIKHLDTSLIDLDIPDDISDGDDRENSSNRYDYDSAGQNDSSRDTCSVNNKSLLKEKTDSILRMSLIRKNEKETDRSETGAESPENETVGTEYTMDSARKEKDGKQEENGNLMEEEQSENSIGDSRIDSDNTRSEGIMENADSGKTLTERLREVPGMDVDKTIERYGAKGDFLTILFTAIVSDGRKKAEVMKKHLEDKNYKEFGIEAHATKSSMATIYAMEISERAKKHEFACKEERYDFVDEDGAAFVEDYLKFLDLVEAALKG
jgi:CheY-like chemotaxis protein